MNIFAIEGNKNNIDFIESAKSQDNYRLVKMILESTQLLCSALHLNNIEGAKYRLTHRNHPCLTWVSESSQNYYDLMEHTNALIKEYYKRFNKKEHKCHPVLKQCYWIFSKNDSKFKTDKTTPFKLVMPKEFQNESDIVDSYRKYYSSKENILYPVDKVPSWMLQYRSKSYKVKLANGKIIIRYR